MITGELFVSLTENQIKEIKLANRKLAIKAILNGVNCGALLGISNFVLILANENYFNSSIILFAMCVLLDIILLKVMRSTRENDLNKFKEKLKEIIENK